MNPIVIFFGSLLTSIFAVKLGIKIAFKINFLDYPNSTRKFQNNPVPKIGGLSIAFAFSSTSFLVAQLFENAINIYFIISVIIPALITGLIGLIDDIRDTNPWIRIFLQIFSGIFINSLGYTINITNSTILNSIIVVGFVVLIINAFNLIDNSDGLAGGTFLITAIFAMLITYLNGQTLVLQLSTSIMGLALGFLIFNWYPAKIYLGDSGVYFMSTLMAILLLKIQSISIEQKLSISVLLLLVLFPLLDMAYVIIKRYLSGINIFTAGRDHLFHLINSQGFKTQISVILLLGIHAFICSIGFTLYLVFA